jgi:hypothetical protein
LFRDWYASLLPAMFLGYVSWMSYYLSEALNYPSALQTLTHHNLGPNYAFFTGATVGLLFTVVCRINLLRRAEEE